MSEANEKFKWGAVVVSCSEDLRENQDLEVSFVDFEVVPPLDGSPDGIFLWFICEKALDAKKFKREALRAATNKVRSRMIKCGFSPESAESLCSDVTSSQDIEAGGGRFSFFR